GESQMDMRADTPYKTIDDVRNAKEPPRCGAQGTSDSAYYLPKLFEEALGAKFNLVQGYPGGPEIDLAVERGEIHCRAFTIEAFLSREPYHTWRKKGFVRNIIQTGKKRDPKLPETPTIWELMDRYKTPETSRRLATVVLASGALGRPMLGTPGIPPERVKILRAAFNATMKDAEFLAELDKRQFDLDPVPGDELEKIVKEVMTQPPDTIARMKKLLGEYAQFKEKTDRRLKRGGYMITKIYLAMASNRFGRLRFARGAEMRNRRSLRDELPASPRLTVCSGL